MSTTGHALGDRNNTVREDKAPTKSAPSKSGGNRGSTLGDTPAAEGCRCYVGNLAWETTEDSLIGTCFVLIFGASERGTHKA